MEWPNAIEALGNHIVRISTPRGSGTGFIVFSSLSRNLCAVATAAHVIDNAHYWEEPIRIQHYGSGKTSILRTNGRATILDEPVDTAIIVFPPGEIPLPASNPQLIPPEKHLRVGHEMGWVGFPGIAAGSLCFFSGRVSAWLNDRHSYLVDGVAINGVSGGPAFHALDEKSVVVIGVVSAYIPNRLTGDVLPGLCEIRDVRQFQELAKTFESLEEAKIQETVPAAPPPRSPEVTTPSEPTANSRVRRETSVTE